MAPLMTFNIASPQFKANPYPIYAQLRQLRIGRAEALSRGV